MDKEFPYHITPALELKDNGSYYFMDRLWVPSQDSLRTLLMDEAHKSRYSIHPGSDKMYKDLRI